MLERSLQKRSVSFRDFGVLPTGEAVQAWTLTGRAGIVLEVLTYGGIVAKLMIPDRTTEWLDLVLGFSDLSSYITANACFGAITGRVAGRISNGRFQLDGKTYSLECNNPPNHLHGGTQGFDKRIWTAMPASRHDGAPSLCLSYFSHDGEEGYPGNVEVSVTYTVTDDNWFLIETEATTDKATPFSLTHHSYFNLGGEGSGSIEDHLLQVDSDVLVPSDENLSLLDRRESVDGRPEDLRAPKLLSDLIPLLHLNHGALYEVQRPATAGDMVRVAELTHPASGRMLTCFTNETHLQTYTASAFDGTWIGKSGMPYGKYAGLCLECEGYANGANAPEIGDIILRPGTPLRRRTAYAFSVRPSNC